MESWRKTWRVGIAPQLSLQGLEKLLEGMRTDDPRIIQGATTNPPPLQPVMDWPVEAGDAIVYSFWRGDNCAVADAEEFFARTCFECDQLLQEPASCRFFLNWYDDNPRQEVFALLIPEIIREISIRVGVPLNLLEAPVEIQADWVEEYTSPEEASHYRNLVLSTQEKSLS